MSTGAGLVAAPVKRSPSGPWSLASGRADLLQNGTQAHDTAWSLLLSPCPELQGAQAYPQASLVYGHRVVWVGSLSADGFCTYLQLEYLEQARALARQKEVSFLLPAVLQKLSYGGPVLRILSVPDDTLIMIREDGAIYFWSPQLKLKRKKQIFGKSRSGKPRWATDVISMPQFNKLIVGTGRCELQLYELSNLEPYCQIGSLEATPLKLDYSFLDSDKCLILYGDDQGCVNILFVASVGELLRIWKKMPKVDNMPNITIQNVITSPHVNYIRWKVHGDWVTQLNYCDSLKAVISSSNHEPTALVIGTTDAPIMIAVVLSLGGESLEASHLFFSVLLWASGTLLVTPDAIQTLGLLRS
ncbi:hypothetical protein GHT09_015612 [Marmota monax]|uniref:Uncharacterized protein n=1 Tax=Marmota monax TaxID=9995 RepID=A0A834PR35_MARMO|nr:hypothetical protein GHT09_015612 [Marmota monax]